MLWKWGAQTIVNTTCRRVALALPDPSAPRLPHLVPLHSTISPPTANPTQMPRTLSSEEYQELGKSQYKRKQYAKAAEAFTNGIDASPTPSAALYDYRAAAHEKLEDFSAAVKDGRLAIRTDKTDVRGYLRTASVLVKMGKGETALGIYAYGMKNVGSGHKDFQLLQQLHDRLTRKLSPPQAIDPLTILPVELVEMIIGYLSFNNMVNCLRVSRGWKDYLTNRPKVWANLDLSGARKPVPRTFLGNAVRYSRGALHTLIVHRVQHTDVLRNIAAACKGLHTLKILSFPHIISDTLIEMAQSAQNLKRISVHTEISIDTMRQILRKRPKLELVDFRDVRLAADTHTNHAPAIEWQGGPYDMLHTLAIQSNSQQRNVGSTYVHSLLQQTPELRSLTLVKTSMVPALRLQDFRLTKLVVKCVQLLVFPIIPSTLERLIYEPERGTLRSPSRAAIQQSCTRSLTHLSLGEDVYLGPDFLLEFLDFYAEADDEEDGHVTKYHLEDGKPLQHLSLRGNIETNTFDGTPSTLSSVPPTKLVSTYLSTSPRILTRALTSLELSGLPLTDDDIDAITESTSLTTIDLSSTRVSGFGIKKLVDCIPTLRHINADYCRNLSSRDVIEYAKKKGVHVSYTMAEPTNGVKGRKVRYG